MVVRAQQDRDVLQGNDDDQRPDDQRKNSVHVRGVGKQPVLGLEALSECVERTRADVAVDYANREQSELRETASVWGSFGVAKNCSEAS